MRTRPLAVAIVTAASLSACWTNPRVSGLEPAGAPAMRVWIHYPVGSSRIHPIFVNRDAHVAMFEIIPGRGATMVYPRGDGDHIATDGHFVDLTFQPGRMFYFADPFGYASVQPRYYYVVASAAPLNLKGLRASLGNTRRALGRAYGSFSPYDAIDRLTEIVVPMQRDEDWATDLFVDWPVAPPFPRTLLAQQWIQCANGRVLLVSASYPYFGCPGDPPVPVQVASTQKPTPPPTRGQVPVAPRPDLPQVDDDGPRPAAPTARDVAERRRAVGGARPPGPRGLTPATTGRDRRDIADRAAPAGRSSGGASQPASPAREETRSRPTESTAPRAEPSASPRAEPRTDARAEPRSPDAGAARSPR